MLLPFAGLARPAGPPVPFRRVPLISPRCLALGQGGGSGRESLAFQGFGHGLQSRREFSEFTEENRCDLAGNAFSAYVILPLMCAAFTYAPMSNAIRLFTAADKPGQPDASDAELTDGDVDDDEEAGDEG